MLTVALTELGLWLDFRLRGNDNAKTAWTVHSEHQMKGWVYAWECKHIDSPF
jgi:hypothetical protein